MNIRYITSLLIGLVVFSVEAQNYNQRQEFAVMNPTSYEMSRFELTPINQYTGKANVNFPLCGIEVDGKQVAFSLAYDTGGVRVSQEATWVGLGWNLSGIPVITHQINQRSDIGTKLSPDIGYCFEERELPEGGLTTDYINWVQSQAGIPYGQPDTQPDVFVANLAGSTVEFQLTQVARTTVVQAIILNESNAQIQYNETTQDFIITDEDGFIYEFNHIEYTTSWSEPAGALGMERTPNQIRGLDSSALYNNQTDRWVPTAWYVDRIISPNNEILEFRYDDEIDNAVNVSVSHPSYHTSAKLSICASIENNGSIGSEFVVNPFFESMSASRSLQETKILSEIENLTTGEKLIFKTDPRLDIHPYSTTYMGGWPYSGMTVDGTPKKLYEIETVSSIGKSVKKVTFQQSYFNEYKTSSSNAVDYLRLKLDGFKIHDQQYAFKYRCDDALPEKHSKATDFWGFYNGMNNSWRIPYLNFGDLNLCQLQDATVFNPNNELSLGAIKGSSFCDTEIGSLTEMRYPTGGVTTFDYEPNEVTIDISDTELNADDFNYAYLLQHNINPEYPKVGQINGNYKTFAVGGLRIKRVTNLDAGGTPLLRKSYNYLETKGSGDQAASGKLMDALHFFRPSLETYSNLNVNISGIILNSNNVFGTNASAMGSFIGYNQVTELVEDKQGTSDIGKVVSSYINIPNESLIEEHDGTSFVVESVPHNYSDANGKLSRQEVYDAAGNPKKFSEFDYNFDIYTNQTAAGVFQPGYKVFYSTLDSHGYVSNNGITDYYGYDARKFVTWQTKSRTVDYFENGTVEKTVHNSYNEKDRIAVTQETISRTPTIDFEASSAPTESLRTELYYPYDTEYGVDSSTISADLVAKNQIGRPIYTRSFNNGNFVGHELTKYRTFNTVLTKPEGVYFSTENVAVANLENRVKYEVYDSYGNLVQYRQPNGVPVSAIWGYQGKYMVAKIENATYAQIENVLGADFDLENAGLTNAQKNNLRALAGTMATFYDYDPLVGPTKITDPRAYETNYTYDNHNRLSEVRDNANNLVEDYRYEYVDAPLYPSVGFSECFDRLVISELNVLDNRTQYFRLQVVPEGGFGNNQIEWFISTETNKRNAQFALRGTGSTFYYEVCCDTEILVKVVVSDGTQTTSRILQNPNYNSAECIEGACDNPF